MKRISIILLLMLITTLAFTSCGISGEEESSITLPEPSSTEPSSVASSDTEFSSVPDNSSIIDTSHSGDGVTSVELPIPYTEEDEQYYNQYTKNFFPFPANFDDPNDLTADELRWIYTFIYDFFPGISDDFGAQYEREDGLFYIPLQDMVTELKKLLGENFEAKLKTHPAYDAKSDCIIVPTFGGLGGAYGVKPLPVPIRREGDNIILPVYFYEDDTYSKITNAKEYTIYEFEGGFYLRGVKRLTEDEITDLNEKYFGEA